MDHAFTDRMVREDKEDLSKAAKDYLLAYKGSFEPVLHARAAVIEGVELNVAQIRTVLNVMRADTSIRMEYTPPTGSNVIQFPLGGRQRDEESPRVTTPKLELVVFGRIKSKYVFGMSMHKRAEVIHYVDHDKTRIVYKRSGASSLITSPRRMGWQKLYFDRIEVQYGWECGSKNPKVRLLTTDMMEAIVNRGLGRLCPTCLSIRTSDVGVL